MFKLDDEFLAGLGLGGLPEDDRKELLRRIYTELELRVGMKIAEGLVDSQLDEFEALMDSGDEAASLAWLEATVPNYKDVVASMLEAVKAELVAAAPMILAEVRATP